MQRQCVKCPELLSGAVLFCPFCGTSQEAGRIFANNKSSNTPAAAPDSAPKPPPIPIQPLDSAVTVPSSPPDAVRPVTRQESTTPSRASLAVPPPIPLSTPSITTTAAATSNLPAAPPATSPLPPLKPTPPPQPASPKEKKRMGCLGCAGFALLALAIAITAGYFYVLNWIKEDKLADLKIRTQTHMSFGEITDAEATIEKIRALDPKSSFINTATEKIAAAKKSAVDAIKKSQSALQNRDLTAARAALAIAFKLDRAAPQLETQHAAIGAREKLRDQALEAMRKCLSVNDFACGKTQANNAMRIDKSYDAMAEFTKGEVAYREAQNNPIQSGLNTIFEAAANAIVRAATDKSDSNTSPPSAPSTNPARAGSNALPDCDQLLLRSKNAKQNRRYDEAVQAAESALAFSPACEGAQEALDSALTARRRAKQLAR